MNEKFAAAFLDELNKLGGLIETLSRKLFPAAGAPAATAVSAAKSSGPTWEKITRARAKPSSSETQRLHVRHPGVGPFRLRTGAGKMTRAEIDALLTEEGLERNAAFLDELAKIAKKDMPHFTEQDRPAKAKEIYAAMTHRKKNMAELRRRYGERAKEVAARVAGRHGEPGKPHRGKPWKEPVQ